LAGAGVTPTALTAVFLTGMRNVFRLTAGLVLAAALVSALRGREYRAGAATSGHVRSVREPARVVVPDGLGGAPAAGVPNPEH
jgi:hypothetical protein